MSQQNRTNTDNGSKHILPGSNQCSSMVLKIKIPNKIATSLYMYSICSLSRSRQIFLFTHQPLHRNFRLFQNHNNKHFDRLNDNKCRCFDKVECIWLTKRILQAFFLHIIGGDLNSRIGQSSSILPVHPSQHTSRVSVAL